MSFTVEHAREALAAGDNDAALRTIRFALEYPRDPGPLDLWCEVLADVARRLGDERLAARADLVATDATDAAALFDVGWALAEARLYGPAATLLAAAAQVRPHEPAILLELAAALEHAGANAAARDVLAAEPDLLESRFEARYLLAFNALLAGDLGGARAAFAALRRGAVADRASVARVRDMLARADAVAEVTPLDADDLRGWHYVLTGGLLLHRNPDPRPGFRGRYAISQDTEARCLEDILRLRRVLGHLQLDSATLLVLPDRDSVIFATAAAKLLRLPVASWSPGTKERGIVVAYDLGAADVDARTALLARRKGQVIWSHALSWTEPVGLSPELVGSLHQVNVPPWGPRLYRDADTGEVRRRPALQASVDELAARVLAAPVEDLPEQSAIEAIASAGDVPAAGWRRSAGNRDPFWFMGPVKSDRLY